MSVKGSVEPSKRVAHAKFQNPTITTSGRKVTHAERERESRKRRKSAVTSGHLVP